MERGVKYKVIVNILTILLVALGVMLGQEDTTIFIVNIVSAVLISFGLIFFLGSCVGLLRFPDFYTRMHAAGKGDTLSSILILLGAVIYIVNEPHFNWTTILVGIKILVIMNFIFIGSPTATHAIMDAGYETGVKHWSNKKRKKS